MNQFKKCQVVMLSTKEKTDICINGSKGLLYGISERDLCNKYCIQKPKYQHLYIISDEEIEQGDLVLYNNKTIFKVNTDKAYQNAYYLNAECSSYCKKIIASTDKSLNLPKPSNSFIEKYCELNGNIKDILVYYPIIGEDWSDITNEPYTNLNTYLYIKNNEITIKKYEEKLYTKEEVLELCRESFREGYYQGNSTCPLAIKIIDNYINNLLKD